MLALVQPALWLVLFPAPRSESLPKQREPGTVVYLPFHAPDRPLELSPEGPAVATRSSNDKEQVIAPPSAASFSQPSASHQRAEVYGPGTAMQSQAEAQKPTQPPLDLTLPKSIIRDAQKSGPSLAAQDPRSNSPTLNFSERFTVNLGSVDCYIDERLPDGTKLRRLGRKVPVERLHSQATGDERPVYTCV